MLTAIAVYLPSAGRTVRELGSCWAVLCVGGILSGSPLAVVVYPKSLQPLYHRAIVTALGKFLWLSLKEEKSLVEEECPSRIAREC